MTTRNSNLYLIMLLLTCLVSSNLIAQEETLDLKYYVYLNVTADKTLESLVYSQVSNNLRQFSDVKLVRRDKAEYSIKIIVLKSPSNYYIGSLYVSRIINYHTIIRAAYQLMYFQDYENDELENIVQENVKMFNETLEGKLLSHSIVDAESKELYVLLTNSSIESLTSLMVAEFNTDVLEPQRQFIDSNPVNNN